MFVRTVISQQEVKNELIVIDYTPESWKNTVNSQNTTDVRHSDDLACCLLGPAALRF
jgi:hypothetical protein